MKMRLISDRTEPIDYTANMFGLAGQKGVGKSTLAEALMRKDDIRVAFADQVRTHAKDMIEGLGVALLDDHEPDKQDIVLEGDQNGATWRNVLQTVGAFFRNNVSKNYWVHALAKHLSEEYDLSTVAPQLENDKEGWMPGYTTRGAAFVDDVRYTNESNYIRNNNGFVIGLRTGPFDDTDAHESEQLSDRWEEMVDIEVWHDYEGAGYLADFITETLSNEQRVQDLQAGQTITYEDVFWRNPDQTPQPENEHVYVYVAGPYTEGDPEDNTKQAIRYGDQLAGQGFVPIIPHLCHWWDQEVSGHDYQFWMNYVVSLLDLADAVLRIPGKSPGADKEVVYAQDQGMFVADDPSELHEEYGTQTKHITADGPWWEDSQPDESDHTPTEQPDDDEGDGMTIDELVLDGDPNDPSTWSADDKYRVSETMTEQHRRAARQEAESGDSPKTDPTNADAWEGGVPGLQRRNVS